MNIIELAKECCDYETDDDIFEFTHDQLTAFANAIVEECAKVADDADLVITAENIRALKVKG